MGSFLQLIADPPKVKIYHENGEDFIEVLSSVKRRDFYRFIGDAQDLTRKADQLTFTTEQLFVLFVTGWSLTDEHGNAVPVAVDHYNNLSLEVGQWIDGKLQEHLQSLIGKQVREDEGKSEASPETMDSDGPIMLNVS